MTLWRPIPGEPDFYRSSDEGGICTIDREVPMNHFIRHTVRKTQGKVCTQNIRRNERGVPHRYVTIHYGPGESKQIRVAHITAITWVETPFDWKNRSERNRWKLTFKDGDTLNCHNLNLAWVRSSGWGRVIPDTPTDLDASSVMSRLFAGV